LIWKKMLNALDVFRLGASLKRQVYVMVKPSCPRRMSGPGAWMVISTRWRSFFRWSRSMSRWMMALKYGPTTLSIASVKWRMGGMCRLSGGLSMAVGPSTLSMSA
jgi:hypothetical protein